MTRSSLLLWTFTSSKVAEGEAQRDSRSLGDPRGPAWPRVAPGPWGQRPGCGLITTTFCCASSVGLFHLSGGRRGPPPVPTSALPQLPPSNIYTAPPKRRESCGRAAGEMRESCGRAAGAAICSGPQTTSAAQRSFFSHLSFTTNISPTLINVKY